MLEGGEPVVTYALVILFLVNGESYVERRGLTLQECAGRAAMIRLQTEGLQRFIGEIRYYCIEEMGA